MPLMHCVRYISTLRKEISLLIVQKQQQYMTGHASLGSVSSKNIGPATEMSRRPYVERDGETEH